MDFSTTNKCIWVTTSIVALFAADAAKALDPIGCLIRPRDLVEVSTPVAGIVDEVFVYRGDRVTAGQVIAKLDTRIDELTLNLARVRASDVSAIEAREARLVFLDQQAKRVADLAERNAVSTAQKDEALSEAKVARFELQQAKAQQELLRLEAEREAALLDQKTLRSPVDGVVTQQLLSPGEFRDGESQIATIARLDTLNVEAFAPLSYFGQIELDDVVSIEPEEPVGGSYPARVTAIDRVFEAATATFGIEMRIDNTAYNLPAGLRCMVKFED